MAILSMEIQLLMATTIVPHHNNVGRTSAERLVTLSEGIRAQMSGQPLEPPFVAASENFNGLLNERCYSSDERFFPVISRSEDFKDYKTSRLVLLVY